MNLRVPFAEKDAAKKLGARWDADRKVWYIMDKDDLTPFAKWSPTPHDGSATPVVAKPATQKDSSSGVVIRGSQYVELPRVCDCLPWEDCPKCRASLKA